MFSPEVQKQIFVLRRIIGMLADDSKGNTDATERVVDRLVKTQTNAEFLATLSKDIDSDRR